MQRNIRLYPLYYALHSTMAWLPIFFLYFNQHLSLAQVLQLEAFYYLCVVCLEVPSGYFSDSVGRRPTLLISAISFTAAYALFFVAGDWYDNPFLLFAIAQVLMATGFAFSSGTDTSFHYDSLDALGLADEYGPREAIVQRNSFIASSIAIILGGLAGMVALRWAYAMAVITVLYFQEPPDGQNPETPQKRTGFGQQLHLSIRYLKDRANLRWIFGFAVLMTILNHIPYEFYQPYLDLLRVDLSLGSSQTPLAAAVVMALSTLLASGAANYSIKIEEAVGTGYTLLLATALQLLLIIAMGSILHPLIVPLILLRELPFGLMRAPMNAAIAPEIAQSQRATYFSLQSLAGRLAFSGTLVGLSLLAGTVSTPDWGVENGLPQPLHLWTIGLALPADPKVGAKL